MPIGEEIKINANKFVVQNDGKLRDHYRIGKMLGSGKSLILDNYTFRRFWRS